MKHTERERENLSKQNENLFRKFIFYLRHKVMRGRARRCRRLKCFQYMPVMYSSVISKVILLMFYHVLLQPPLVFPCKCHNSICLKPKRERKKNQQTKQKNKLDKNRSNYKIQRINFMCMYNCPLSLTLSSSL